MQTDFSERIGLDMIAANRDNEPPRRQELQPWFVVLGILGVLAVFLFQEL